MKSFKLFYVILALIVSNIQASELTEKTEERFAKKTSFSFYQQKDSLLFSEYNRLLEKVSKEKEYTQSLYDALSLFEASKKADSFKMQYKSLYLIAEIYRRTRDHRRSLNYYKKSLAYLELDKNESKELQTFSQSDYAENLFMVASEYQLMFLKDSARIYYNRVNKMNSLNSKILEFQAKSYSNLSGIYQNDSLYDQSRIFAQKAIEIQKKRNDKLGQANAINNLANIYLLEGDFEKSKSKYLEGLRLIQKDSSTRATRIKSDLYFNLAWAMRNLKEYQAYDNLETSYIYQDNLRALELQQTVEQVTAKYNVDAVKKEGELKRQILINKQQRAERTTWVIGISSLFIIILLVSSLNQYKLRQKNLNLEMSRKELIQSRKIEKLKADSQIRILNATIDGKETERKQIAEILHDNVSALLSSANLHLQACRTQFGGKMPIEIDKTQGIINEASYKIRDLSHTLVSSILLKFGLAYAIKDMSEKYSNSQITFEYETKNIRRYSQGFEIKVNNIIQEFINNILKHSNATRANIFIEDREGLLLIKIEDNGRGFDKNVIPEKDGLGINQIDARIQVMKGSFQIDTEKGKGTKITIEVPISEKEIPSIV